jgi:uncharacterized protein (DUF362 family)
VDSRSLLSVLFRAQDALRKGVTRREFICTQTKSALLFAALSSGLFIPRRVLATASPDIVIAKGSPGAATRAAVGLLGGMEAFVKPGDKVVVKPNMSFARGPDSATNTDPEVVREIVAMCKEAGAGKVRVVDHPLRPNEECVEGVKDACSVFGDTSVQALEDKDFYRRTALPLAEKFKKTDVMKDVLDADVLIAVPVAKSHSSTGVSLSMKGMMGLILNRTIMHWRYDLSSSIVDLCTFLKPDLVVIDGTRVLSTNGPGGPGNVLKFDTVIASRDMVAADATAVAMFEWYGKKMQPRQVKHIRIAHERGLGRMDTGNLITKKVQV